MKSKNPIKRTPEWQAARHEMLNLMVLLYGNFDGDPNFSIKFPNKNKKEISRELGYGDDEINRYISPNQGDEKSLNLYNRVIQRLKVLVENKAAKAENKQLKIRLENLELDTNTKNNKGQSRLLKWIIGILLVALSYLVWMVIHFQNKSEKKIVTPVKIESRLADAQTDAILDLYEQNIQNIIIIKALIFNAESKDEYHKNHLEQNANLLRDDIVETAIIKQRDYIRKTNFKAADGQLLIDYIEQLSDNNLEENFTKLKIYLADPTISPTNLVEKTRIIVLKIQQEFRSKMNSQIQKNLTANPTLKYDDSQFKLTKEQRDAVMELYARSIKMEIALKGLAFHYSFFRGDYENKVDVYLDVLLDKVANVQFQNRDLLKRMNFKAEDGNYLETIATQNTQNNLEQNFEILKTSLLNRNLSPIDVINEINENVSTVHRINFSLLDNTIKNNLAKQALIY